MRSVAFRRLARVTGLAALLLTGGFAEGTAQEATRGAPPAELRELWSWLGGAESDWPQGADG